MTAEEIRLSAARYLAALLLDENARKEHIAARGDRNALARAIQRHARLSAPPDKDDISAMATFVATYMYDRVGEIRSSGMVPAAGIIEFEPTAPPGGEGELK